MQPVTWHTAPARRARHQWQLLRFRCRERTCSRWTCLRCHHQLRAPAAAVPKHMQCRPAAETRCRERRRRCHRTRQLCCPCTMAAATTAAGTRRRLRGRRARLCVRAARRLQHESRRGAPRPRGQCGADAAPGSHSLTLSLARLLAPQVEFYFSAANLARDEYLRKQIDADVLHASLRPVPPAPRASSSPPGSSLRRRSRIVCTGGRLRRASAAQRVQSSEAPPPLSR